MSCSWTQHGVACGDRTQDLSIRSPTLYNYTIALRHDVLVNMKIHVIYGVFQTRRIAILKDFENASLVLLHLTLRIHDISAKIFLN